MLKESYELFNKRLAKFEARYGVVTPELKKQLREIYVQGTLDGLILPFIVNGKLKEVASDD